MLSTKPYFHFKVIERLKVKDVKIYTIKDIIRSRLGDFHIDIVVKTLPYSARDTSSILHKELRSHMPCGPKTKT